MPTLLALDCSLSMLRVASPSQQHGSDPSHSLLDLAKHGLDLVLANIESSHRLEHVSLVWDDDKIHSPIVVNKYLDNSSRQTQPSNG